MADLWGSHLRYLLVIYELRRIKPDVGTQDIAKTLNCSKASVAGQFAQCINVRRNLPEPGQQAEY